MPKKSFDTHNATDKLFTESKHDTHNTHDKPATPKKQGRPIKEVKLRGYRYNLNLDADLKNPLQELVWRNRTTATQFINDLIRAELEKESKKGGKLYGWKYDEG